MYKTFCGLGSGWGLLILSEPFGELIQSWRFFISFIPVLSLFFVVGKNR